MPEPSTVPRASTAAEPPADAFEHALPDGQYWCSWVDGRRLHWRWRWRGEVADGRCTTPDPATARAWQRRLRALPVNATHGVVRIGRWCFPTGTWPLAVLIDELAPHWPDHDVVPPADGDVDPAIVRLALERAEDA